MSRVSAARVFFRLRQNLSTKIQQNKLNILKTPQVIGIFFLISL